MEHSILSIKSLLNKPVCRPIVLVSALICCVNLSGLAQTAISQNKNYIITYSPRTELADETVLSNKSVTDVSADIDYFDGLGRLEQSVQIKGSPLARDVIQPVQYDLFNREIKKYLPYVQIAAKSGGAFQAAALTEQNSFYQDPAGTTYMAPKIPSTPSGTAYSESLLEASPLNRLLQQGAPGDAWKLSGGHSIKLDYSMNNETGFSDLQNTRKVLQFGVTIAADGTRTLSYTGAVYKAAELSVTIIKDENWSSGRSGTTEEYKNKEGRVVLKRTFNDKAGVLEPLSTYFVYDVYGNLCYVLPPGIQPDNFTTVGPTQASLDLWAYQYRYDSRRRLVEKRLPGKQVENFVYNKLDQLVAREDARKRSSKQWEYTKYDGQGRVIATGWWVYKPGGVSTAISRTDLQKQVDTYMLADNVTPAPLWEGRAALGIGYDNLAWPASSDFYVVNYYDNYNVHLLPGTFGYDSYTKVNTGSDNIQSERTQGLPTVTQTASVNWSRSRWTVNYYNSKGQLIQSQKNLTNSTATSSFEDGKDVINYEYDFTGNILLTSRKHISSVFTSGAPLMIRTRFQYDHRNRQTHIYKRVGTTPVNDPEILLALKEYNQLGQLVDKKLHQTTPGGKFLQSVDYRYNIRGWLTSINNADWTSSTASYTNNEDPATESEADKFGLELAYDTRQQFNGNIGSMTWHTQSQTANAPKLKYDFTYDKVNRLTAAISINIIDGTASNLYNESMTYDAMGNIQSLVRNTSILGVLNQIDNLTYSYTGNQLKKVSDASTSNKDLGFKDGINTDDDYSYNTNGDLLKDKNKGISNTNMGYQMDKVSKVTMDNGDVFDYEYERTGEKMTTTWTSGTNQEKTWYRDGIQYSKYRTDPMKVDFVQTEEGRVKIYNGTYSYEYDLKDHLGNTRVTLRQNPLNTTAVEVQVIQANSYYAFGMNMEVDGQNGSADLKVNKYLYNGKEMQHQQLGWLDYGARMYDPTIGRWNGMDKLAELFVEASPYNYVTNNPILMIDPDGMTSKDIFGRDKEDANGMYIPPIDRPGGAGAQGFGDPNYGSWDNSSTTTYYYQWGLDADGQMDPETFFYNGSITKTSNTFVWNANQRGGSLLGYANPASFNLGKVGDAYVTNITNPVTVYESIDVSIYPLRLSAHQAAVVLPNLYVQVRNRGLATSQKGIAQAWDEARKSVQRENREGFYDANPLQASKDFISSFRSNLKTLFGGLPVVTVSPFQGTTPTTVIDYTRDPLYK